MCGEGGVEMLRKARLKDAPSSTESATPTRHASIGNWKYLERQVMTRGFQYLLASLETKSQCACSLTSLTLQTHM